MSPLNICTLTVSALACCAFSPMAKAASLVITSDGTKLTGITFSEPLVFTTTSNYVNTGLQIRIYDLYPTSTTYSSGVVGSGLSVAINSETQNPSVSLTQYPIGDNLGGSELAGDMIIWLNSGTVFSIASGDTVTLSGSAAVSAAGPGFARGLPPAAIAVPASGTYQAYLVSSQDGTNISLPISVQISPVPEPASGALALLGATGLLLRRKRN